MVIIGQLSTFRHSTFVVLLRKLQGTIDEVAIDCNQLIVATSLEICPSEVVVLGFRSIGCKHIAQFILTTWQFIEVFIEPYGIVLRGAYLVAFEVQELIRWNIVGQDVFTMSFQHCREHDAMEHDIVFADEMDKSGLGVFPPSLPRAQFRMGVAQFLSIGDVTDGSIEPNIEHLSLCSLNRNRNTPVEVASNGTRMQTTVEPALALTIDIGTPFLVLLQNPLLKPSLVLVERQIPMLCLALHQRIAGLGIIGIDKFLGRESGSTLLTLVAVCFRSMTTRAFTLDITVGEEVSRLFIIELLGHFLHELAFVVEFLEEVACQFVMSLAGGTAIHIERNAEAFERILDEIMIAVNHLLNGDSLLTGTDGNGYTMFVGTTDKQYIASLKTKVAHIDVSRHIDTGKMSDMYWAVGIRQSRGYCRSFEILFHIAVLRFCGYEVIRLFGKHDDSDAVASFQQEGSHTGKVL